MAIWCVQHTVAAASSPLGSPPSVSPSLTEAMVGPRSPPPSAVWSAVSQVSARDMVS